MRKYLHNTASIHYPFGMTMESYSNIEFAYSYGMNTQEKDDEIYGEGNSYSAEYWQYDARLGRRWNVDPMTSSFPHISPYSCFNGNPVFYSDPVGLQGEPTTHTVKSGETLWGVSKKYYDENKDKIGTSWAAYWNSIKDWNAGGDYGKVGGTIYLSDPNQKVKTEVTQRDKDRKKFLEDPINESNKTNEEQGFTDAFVNSMPQIMNKSLNFYSEVTVIPDFIGFQIWPSLYHRILADDDIKKFENDILKQVKGHENLGKTSFYIYDAKFIQIGYNNKAMASLHQETWSVRNVYVKCWAEVSSNGSVVMHFRFCDVLDLKPDTENKDPLYNQVTTILSPMYPGNQNMQIKMEWHSYYFLLYDIMNKK